MYRARQIVSSLSYKKSCTPLVKEIHTIFSSSTYDTNSSSSSLLLFALLLTTPTQPHNATMVKFTAVLASSAAFFAFALAAPVVTPFSSVPYWPLVSLKTFSSPHCHFEDANTQSWLIVDPASSGCHDFAVAKDQQVMSYVHAFPNDTNSFSSS